jgi:hypothetical protein
VGFYSGAGNGNRTRTISLGIRPIGASDGPDLGNRYTASDRHEPHETGVNGPLMARGLMATAALVASPRTSGPMQSIADSRHRKQSKRSHDENHAPHDGAQLHGRSLPLSLLRVDQSTSVGFDGTLLISVQTSGVPGLIDAAGIVVGSPQRRTCFGGRPQGPGCPGIPRQRSSRSGESRPLRARRGARASGATPRDV